MRIATRTLLLLALAATAAAGPSREDLERDLVSGDIEKGLEAALAFRKMGEKAVPSLPFLIRALDVEVPARIGQLHWHPWQGMIRPFRMEVLATIRGLGPKAKEAAPSLLGLIHRGHALRMETLYTILAIDPKGEATIEGLLAALEAGRLSGRDVLDAPFEAWLIERGARAAKALAAAYARDQGTGGGDRCGALLVRLEGEKHEHSRRLLREHEDSGFRRRLLGILARAAPLSDDLLPMTVRIFLAREAWDDDLAFVLSRASAEAVGLLEPTMAAFRYGDARWHVLRKRAPALAARLTGAWLRKHREEPAPAGEDGLARTMVRGGADGGEFEVTDAEGRPVVALLITTGFLGTDSIVRSMRPVFLGPDGAGIPGKRNGRPGGKERSIAAPEGYALAGLLVKTGARVEGFAPIWMRLCDDRLDPTDAQIGGYVGAITRHEPTVVGGDGRRVVGLCGRTGADIDAIGLVLRKD